MNLLARLWSRLFASSGSSNAGPLDPFWYSMLGTRTASGEYVSAEVARSVAAIDRGVKVISEGVAKMPCKVYRRLPGGGKEEAPEHPIAHLFRLAANDTDTPFDLWDHLLGSAILRGKGYAEIVAGPKGFADSLIPLDFDAVKEARVKGPGKRLTFTVRDEDGRERALGQDKVFRLCGPDGGKSLLARMRETAGTARAAEGYGAEQFGRAPQMAGFLSPKAGTAMDQAALKAAAEAFREANAGRGKWHRAAVLPGLEWHGMGMTNEAAQYLGLRKFLREEIAIFLGVPPHKLGVMDKASYASVEAQNRALVDDCLQPWANRLEQAIAMQLLLDPDTYFVRFNFDALLRGTTLDRAQAEAIWVQNGIKTRNEIREVEDSNHLPGLDEPLTPVSNAQAPSTAPRAPARSAPADDEEPAEA